MNILLRPSPESSPKIPAFGNRWSPSRQGPAPMGELGNESHLHFHKCYWWFWYTVKFRIRSSRGYNWLLFPIQTLASCPWTLRPFRSQCFPPISSPLTSAGLPCSAAHTPHLPVPVHSQARGSLPTCWASSHCPTAPQPSLYNSVSKCAEMTVRSHYHISWLCDTRPKGLCVEQTCPSDSDVISVSFLFQRFPFIWTIKLFLVP